MNRARVGTRGKSSEGWLKGGFLSPVPVRPAKGIIDALSGGHRCRRPQVTSSTQVTRLVEEMITDPSAGIRNAGGKGARFTHHEMRPRAEREGVEVPARTSAFPAR
jgi:hypothetical protein